MMETIGDFHIHTKWCGHAKGDMEEYVARACDLGLPAVGFSAVESILSRVVLPAPLGPRSPKIAPASALKLTFVTA